MFVRGEGDPEANICCIPKFVAKTGLYNLVGRCLLTGDYFYQIVGKLWFKPLRKLKRLLTHVWPVGERGGTQTGLTVILFKPLVLFMLDHRYRKLKDFAQSHLTLSKDQCCKLEKCIP